MAQVSAILELQEQVQKIAADLAEEKKKTALLRKALKQEREEKLKQLQEAADKLGILECKIGEKDAMIEMLRLEKDNLANGIERLKEQRSPEQEMSPTWTHGRAVETRSGRAFENLEVENKKLLDEVHSLLNDQAKLHERLKIVTKEKELGDMQAAAKVEDLTSQLEDVSACLVKMGVEYEMLQAEHAELRKNSLSQHESKTRLEEKAKELKALADSSSAQVASLTEAVEEKKLIIQTLSDRLVKISEDNADLANKMMELKNDLIDAQVNYQTFDVVKVGRIMNSSAKLTIKRNFNGEPVVEWELRGHKYIYKANAVDNVNMHPTREDHFVIGIMAEREKEFVSEQASFIVKKLREFLVRTTSLDMS